MDRRSGAVPRPPYNSFPFLPPSQGGGWRRDGPGRAPAGRRRHILPHRLPGLHGERAARPLPCLPALGAGTPGAPVGARAGPRSRLMALPGNQAVVALTVPTRGPGCLGPGGQPRGIQDYGVGGGQPGPFSENFSSRALSEEDSTRCGQTAIGKQSGECGAGWGMGRASGEAGLSPGTPLPAGIHDLHHILPCPSLSTTLLPCSVPPRTPEAECPDPKETLLWLGLGS